MIPKAEQIAREAHEGQEYAPGVPYHLHLAHVYSELVQAGCTDATTLATAWLHDVVEDTPVTLPELARLMGEDVAGAVAVLTDGPGNRRERKAAMCARFVVAWACGDSHPILVKMADRAANMAAAVGEVSWADARPDLATMYRREWPAFQAAVCPDAEGGNTVYARLRARLVNLHTSPPAPDPGRAP